MGFEGLGFGDLGVSGFWFHSTIKVFKSNRIKSNQIPRHWTLNPESRVPQTRSQMAKHKQRRLSTSSSAWWSNTAQKEIANSALRPSTSGGEWQPSSVAFTPDQKGGGGHERPATSDGQVSTRVAQICSHKWIRVVSTCGNISTRM